MLNPFKGEHERFIIADNLMLEFDLGLAPMSSWLVGWLVSGGDLVNLARLQTRPGPFSGEFGLHAWRIRPTPLENSACRQVNSDYLSFIIKLLINI